jgi:hypothetical protein
MNTSERPTFFYLFRDGDDIKIRKMTDVKALELREGGQEFLDKAQNTLAEAEHVRLLWLSKGL